MAYNDASVLGLTGTKSLKYSIRCIKDEVSNTKETGDNSIPNEFQLFQNYPNPFNPKTMVEYIIPEQGFVSLKVFNVLGNEISTLISGTVPAGEHSVEWNAQDFPSGVYFYHLEVTNLESNMINTFSETKKMMLMK